MSGLAKALRQVIAENDKRNTSLKRRLEVVEKALI
jgi:hypothetical protein